MKLGECFAIPLPDRRYAYGQYVYRDENMLGQIARIFDLVTEEEAPVERLEGVGLMFPPVSVSVQMAVDDGRWKIIGSMPVGEFELPLFRDVASREPGTYHNWWLYDGRRDIHLGDLPPEYRALELPTLWSIPGLEVRIARGGEYVGNHMV